VLLFLLGSLPAALVSEWAAWRHREEAADEFEAQSRAVATGLAEAGREYLEDQRRMVAIIAATARQLDDWSPETLRPMLDAQVDAAGTFHGVYIAGTDGVSIAYSPPISGDGTPSKAGDNYLDRAYFKEVLRTRATAWSGVLHGKQSKRNAVIFGEPVLSEGGDLMGVVGAAVRLNRLQHLVFATNPSENVRVLIVDPAGRVVADTSDRLGHGEQLDAPDLVESACPSASRGLVDETADTVLGVCRTLPLGNTHLRVWVTEPAAHIAQRAAVRERHTRQALLAQLLFIALVSALLSSSAARLMARLVPKVDKLGRGDLDVALRPSGWSTPRELAAVRNAAGRMLERMRSNRDRAAALVEELEEANKKLKPLAAAWDQIGEAVEILDAEGRILFANPACVEALGAPATAVGQPSTLLADERGPMLSQAFSERRGWTGEVEIDGPDGHRLHAVTASPVFENSALVRIIVIRWDLTEQRAAEAVAAHSARLASVGTLAAGLAHEINNPLTYVRMHLETLADGARDLQLPEMVATTTDCIEGVDHIGRVVKGLLLLARRRDPSRAGNLREPIAVRALVDSAVTLSQARFKERASVRTKVPGGLMVSVRVAELTQVLINLLVNAGLAYPPGPPHTQQVWVRAGEESLQDGALPMVWIEVQDEGAGMSPEVLARAFDPFFTTRTVGQGTGLGLAVSRSIVEAHGGTLEARSTPGEGSLFRIRLPGRTGDTLPPIRLAPDARKRIKVLVVDDDPLVARTLARLLRQHDVRVAIGGIAALDALEEELVDVVLSDVMMPDLDGPMLHAEIAARWPALARRFAFVTGAPRGSSVIRALDQTGRPVLHKPVDGNTLANCVQLLARELSGG